jgi:hypothetical protein
MTEHTKRNKSCSSTTISTSFLSVSRRSTVASDHRCTLQVLSKPIKLVLVSRVAAGGRGICRRSCTCIPLERIGLLPWCTSSGNPCNRWRVCSCRSRSPPSSPTHEEEAAPTNTIYCIHRRTREQEAYIRVQMHTMVNYVRLKSASIRACTMLHHGQLLQQPT